MNPEYVIVKQPELLHKLKKMKLISMPKEHARPTSPSTGRPSKRWWKRFVYVDEAKDGLSSSTWKTVVVDGNEHEFMIIYFDGCFFPFVIKKITFK